MPLTPKYNRVALFRLRLDCAASSRARIAEFSASCALCSDRLTASGMELRIGLPSLARWKYEPIVTPVLFDCIGRRVPRRTYDGSALGTAAAVLVNSIQIRPSSPRIRYGSDVKLC